MEVCLLDICEIVSELEEVMKRWKVLDKEWKYV
jgi:hypothetical protein